MIFYKKEGEGPVLVLLHGFCETHKLWDQLLEKLITRCCVIRVDLPGFGKSERISHPSMESYANEVLRVLQKEYVNNCTIIGHSMGGICGLGSYRAKSGYNKWFWFFTLYGIC